jgi:hypothetical protein
MMAHIAARIYFQLPLVDMGFAAASLTLRTDAEEPEGAAATFW